MTSLNFRSGKAPDKPRIELGPQKRILFMLVHLLKQNLQMQYAATFLLVDLDSKIVVYLEDLPFFPRDGNCRYLVGPAKPDVSAYYIIEGTVCAMRFCHISQKLYRDTTKNNGISSTSMAGFDFEHAFTISSKTLVKEKYYNFIRLWKRKCSFFWGGLILKIRNIYPFWAFPQLKFHHWKCHHYLVIFLIFISFIYKNKKI